MQAHEFLGRAPALMVERGKKCGKPETERLMDKALQAFGVIAGMRLNIKREQEGTA